MDAGLIEYLREFQIITVSSADLLQHFGAILTDAQIESHRQAGIIIHCILDRTFAWIRENLNACRTIDEWQFLKEMQRLIANEPIYMDSPPFLVLMSMDVTQAMNRRKKTQSRSLEGPG